MLRRAQSTAIFSNFTVLCQVTLVSLLTTFGGASLAQAQNVDWLVNINDSGFDPQAAGGTVEYTVSIDNNGSTLAPATELSVAIPATTQLTAISGDFSGCEVGGNPVSFPVNGPDTVICDVGTIAAGTQTETGIFSVLAQADGVIEVTASVPEAGDSLLGNNSPAEATTIEEGSDLGISFTSSTPPTSVASGDFIDFELTVINNGPDASGGFTIDFPIPEGVTNITGAGGGGLPAGCSIVTAAPNNEVQCSVSGPLNVSNTLVRAFRGQVSAEGGSTITSTASVLSDDLDRDPITSNNTVVANTSTDPGTDVSIDITQSGGGNLLVDDDTRFTITSAYTGSAPNNLTIRTTIPDEYSFTLADISSPSGYICAITPGTQEVVCTFGGGGAAGANVSLPTITIDATVVSAGTTNTVATIETATPNETNLTNNTASVGATTAARFVNLRPNKAGPNPALAVIGNQYNYGLSVTNLGNSRYVGRVQMRDTLPSGMEVSLYVLNGWTCTPPVTVVGPAVIDCEREYTALDPLEPNATTPQAVLRTRITTATPTSTTRTNTMEVTALTSDVADTRTTDNPASYTVTVEPSGTAADVSVTKAALVPSVVAGEIQTFTIEMINEGPEPSDDVRLTDNLQALINGSEGATEAGFISATIDQGIVQDEIDLGATFAPVSCSSSGSPAGTTRSLTCTAETLPVCTPGDDCPVITVMVRPGGNGGNRTNTASITSFGTPDPDLSNRLSVASFDVEARADVTVAKNATPNPGVTGQDITFVITATNLNTFAGSGALNQLSEAENVIITDDLPDNVTFVSATPSAGTCTTEPAAGAVTNSSQLICDLEEIASGAQQSVTVVLRPNNATNGTTILNEVAVATDTTETDATNNDADISVAILDPTLDILVNKDDTVDPVIIGSNTVYSLRVTNAGPSASENVVVTDVLPDDIFAYRSHTISANGSCGTVPIAQVTPDPDPANRTLECTFPYLESGASETIEVTMEAIRAGTIRNDVSISSDEIVANFDTREANNETSETTTARAVSDVAVTSKVPSQATLNLREGFDFVITVENNPDTAGQVAADTVVTDTLPTGMVLTGQPTARVVSGTASLNSCTGAADDVSFQCDFGDVSETAVIELTVPVKVIAISAAGEMFTNTATVATTSIDLVAGNNSSSGVVTVNGSSLAGTVYRDFDDSATPTMNGQNDPLDTGIVGITMTLTGTAVDGEMITETAITDGMGEYIFPFLPAGTYLVTRGTVNEAGLVTGQNTVGSEGGTLPSRGEIANISLPINTAATDYDFAEVPGAEMPDIALVKGANISALSSPPQAGEQVTYTFTVRNTGNVTLTNVTLTDTVPGVTLMGTPIPSLLPGGENSTAYTATYTLAPEDLGGTIENTATASGTPPTGPDVSDISGTTFENDTPTGTPIPLAPPFVPNPGIALNKTVDETALDDGSTVGDILSYGFVVTNIGNVTLYDVTVTDAVPGVVLTGDPIPQLEPGERNTTAYSATYTLTATDISNRQFVNDASVTGATNSGGTPVVEDDDREVSQFQNIEAIPEVFPPFDDGGMTTSMLDSDLLNGEPATLDNVTITVLREDDGVTLDPTTGIITLAPGFPAGTYEVDYEICAIGIDGLCDTTTEVVVQRANPGIEATKTQSLTDNGDGIEGVGDTLVYEITVENTGNIALDSVTPVDTMTDFAGAPATLTTGPDFVSSSDGSPEGSLAIGEMATYRATFVVTEDVVNAGGVENSVNATAVPTPIPGVPDIPDQIEDISDNGDDSDGNSVDDPTSFAFTPVPLTQGDVTLTKSTTSDVVRRGDAVPYTLTLRNDTDFGAGPFTLVDTLPPGFLFIPNSASITPTDVLPGKITWTGLQVPARSVLEVTLSARVLTGVRAGDHINRADLLDPTTGERIVPEATATVRLVPEPVFDCGDVIGKVFTDLNGDGYQNAPGAAREDGITDQAYAGGKAGKLGAPAPTPKTEKGIPNVRLVTVDGSIITTDENGLYSVPCAMLPLDRGSNFILKLDTRTLPTGYRVTTENPRVVRLTPGMMTELNFGATLGKVVRVDIDASAFGVTQDGKVALSDPLKRGIAQLLPQIAEEAINLRLTFHVPQNADAQTVRAARKMMGTAEAYIKREWRKVGRTRLLVEQSIARAGQ